MGEIKFEGLTVFKEECVRPLFKLQPGDVYKESQFKKGYDKLRDAYGGQGYFQWTRPHGAQARPREEGRGRHPRAWTRTSVLRGQIRFTGNDTTRDKVIRREVYLNEGDVFNTEALKLSIRRINQLGYFKPMEGAPRARARATLGEDKLDVTFKVEEQNRNQFTFGGGVSAAWRARSSTRRFSTANFLGLGETFQISAQSGRRTKNYQIAITEPYLFDRPITAGIDLFKRKLDVRDLRRTSSGYSQDGTGAQPRRPACPLGRFTRVFANYSYEVIDIDGLERARSASTPTSPSRPDGQPVFDPFLFGEDGRRTESRLTPVLRPQHGRQPLHAAQRA